MELREFALGELGWTTDRWRSATLPEFNTAARGYWTNWERSTAWLMREIVFHLIIGNPNIKREDKPGSVMDIYKIRDDLKQIEKKKAECQVSPEDMEEIHQNLLKQLNDGAVK